MHVPAAIIVAVAPDTVQTPVVSEAKLTDRPDDALASGPSATAAPTTCGAIALNVMLCAFSVTVRLLFPEPPVIPAVAELRIAETGEDPACLRDRIGKRVDSGPSDWNRRADIRALHLELQHTRENRARRRIVALRFT